MTKKIELHEEVIENLIKEIHKKLPEKEAQQLAYFVNQYYFFVSPDDLKAFTLADLYAKTLSHWQFLKERKPNEAKLRVFTPRLDQHGWQGEHTIIEIVADDLPFLVESVLMALVKEQLSVHLLIKPPVLLIERNAQGKLTHIAPQGEEVNGNHESVLHIEVDNQPDAAQLKKIETLLHNVIRDVEAVVHDWQPMTQAARDLITSLSHTTLQNVKQDEKKEAIDFINWLIDGNFTFLGSCEYKFVEKNNTKVLEPIAKTGHGLLRAEGEYSKPAWLKDISLNAESQLIQKELLIVTKLIENSSVHRASAPYSISIERVDQQGKVVGELRLVGLFTSAAYNNDIQLIPILRRKVASIIERSKLPAQGHASKELLNILTTLPRDEMFQGTNDELYAIAMGIMHMQERPKIRLFVRRDFANRFFSCLVFVPRDIFSSKLRQRIGEVLCENLHGTEVTFQVRVSESNLARIHFIIRLPAGATEQKINHDELEQKVIKAGRTWEDELRVALMEAHGESQGVALYGKYRTAFPAGYRENFTPKNATLDIQYCEGLGENKSLDMIFYRSIDQQVKNINLKLYHLNTAVPLSDVLPMLENMGLRVLTESSYPITLNADKKIWLSDFTMQYQQANDINVEQVKTIFQDAFAQIWWGNVENDGFNRLVLAGQLTWKEINVLRAYAKFFRQINSTFSQSYIEQALANHPAIAKMLVDLFELYFNPSNHGKKSEEAGEKSEEIIRALDSVSSLDEDRILRKYLNIIGATMRTNYYQSNPEGQYKGYMSFKIRSNQVLEMPLPHPLFEIFVYSPKVEGVHLRSAKVARGGLRWSDRFEDFRTEVLGLMKAQQVKNSVIVPAGAKGGFVCKRLPTDGNRDVLMQEVIRCYSTFISGLLDITDNLHGEKVVPPKDVVRRDEDDPYLVVAADKGTATFSDIANGIAAQYQFWLGDAFASGGSAGYDHKKMGITAKGAWVSVSRHFRELNIDIQRTDFTVVGVGDMSGDVFGNGMLLSEHIKLIAAFNHQHIFLDPNPDTKKSFAERQRMFNLPRSSWMDYDTKLISKGGGIYSRAAKSIELSKEIREALKFDKEHATPTELIQAILKAPVDLLWNGGIGTYVKANVERNMDVGDRANDAVRINGKDLRCKVVGEGGNLGFTQLGRIEYCLQGGRCYTDFVDNSGGVDCSDHEVNLKILLNSIEVAGDLTEKHRNQILVKMTEPVAEQVLQDNYQQTQAISYAESRAKRTIDEQIRFIHTLERYGRLDRSLEFLPNDEQLAQRKANGLGLTYPELSILMAYSKMYLKESLLNSEIPEDSYLEEELCRTFLEDIGVKYASFLKKHKLRRELIVMRLSNAICNEMGATFVTRLYDETGATPAEVARCFVVAREVFSLRKKFDAIEALDNKVSTDVQKLMMTDVIRLVRRATRWFLRNRRLDKNIAKLVDHFAPQVSSLENAIPELVAGVEKNQLEKNYQHYVMAGVPEELAMDIASSTPMISALDIVEAAEQGNIPLKQVGDAYFAIGEQLKLDWFREELDKHLVANTWDALARAACKDDLDRQQRTITMAILQYPKHDKREDAQMLDWLQDHKVLVERWLAIVAELKATKVKEFTMFTVALRELLDLAHTSIRKVGKK